MKEKKELPKLVVFAILTLITALSWVGFEIYRALTVKPDPVVPPEVILELNPELDLQTLEGLVNKVYLEDAEIGETVLLTPGETLQPTEVDLEIESEEQIEEIATESGQTT